ncbi:hypothetical protein MMC30_006259 [Trapelia coarctata]|nr:hypothetical protein [Trapelia coarctata]
MFYDLNVPYTSNHVELQRTLAFLAERYNTIALNHTISGKLPSDLVLSRLTFVLTTPASTPRLQSLVPHYDILALRPTTPQTLTLACQSTPASLISLDLTSSRLFHLPRKSLHLATQTGIRFEICYGAGVLNADGGTHGHGEMVGMARRNLITNATALVRATSGRGIIVSSEAAWALACRGPWDVGNLAMGWGLSGERGREAVGREARAVVVKSASMREGWRGVVDVVWGGEKPVLKKLETEGKGKGKRKADVMMEKKEGKGKDGVEEKPISKREMKRRAKKARMEGKGDEVEEKGATKEKCAHASAAVDSMTMDSVKDT